MKKTFRIISSLVLVLVLLCSTAVSFAAQDPEGSGVTYKGKAKEFIFQPGSDYSVNDLFTNFKGVMPGDTLTQQINVRNDASKKVNVKIYIMAFGAAELENADNEEIVSMEDSADFLKEMKLTVDAGNNRLFESPADQTAGLTDWVLLGTFRSGADVDLNVNLEVPITMGNDYQERIGALDWQFMAEEFPLNPDDPSTPTDPDGPDDHNKTKTGDDSNMLVYGLIALAALGGAAVVIVTRRRKS